ncbi:hypothetical protein [Brevundimonas sp. KM4]|uniref:hypothetical protein n=1 Tax=Brevundimonas sp. KM4 TaxID=1628191 RepID=UPI000696FFBB|nr:hypothetical protein [Brevundimonas sp. KM4]
MEVTSRQLSVLSLRRDGSGAPRADLLTYLPLVLLLALRLAAPSTAGLAYIGLGAYALLGRRQAIYALTLSWLFTMVNPDIAPESTGAGAGRYLVMLAAASSALLRSGFLTRHLQVRPFTVATVLLSGFFVLHSVLVSPLPDVSILKALSWGLTMTALLSLWLGLSPSEFVAATRDLFWGLTLVLVLSLPFLVLPAGHAVNGTGFQGILNHPQAFGMTMALLGAWAGARMFGERRPSWMLIALTGGSLVSVFLSEARTGGVAMVLGLGLSLVLSPVFAGRSLVLMAPGFGSGRVWLTLGAGAIASVAMAATFAELIGRFLSKSNRSGTSGLFDAYEASRGFLIDRMVANIADDPLRGIGFGIASEPSLMVVERDPVLGLPLGAAIEKGIAPLAVLEELGVIGALLVAAWIIWLLRRGAVGGLAPFAVCLTALALNMGENTLFSPGGQGMLPLILFGWIYAGGSRRAGSNA